MYRENPGLLAKYAREDIDWTKHTPNKLETVDIKNLYDSLWGVKPRITLPKLIDQEPELNLEDIMTPIDQQEIHKRITRIKASVAAGPDGLRKQDISRMAARELLWLWFNIVMVRGYQPAAWRKNRTTLLPKNGQDLSQVTNYRPITISSILARLYWGIVDQKLRRSVRMNPRQKGFTSEAGCFNNVHILSELLRHSKITEGLVAVQLDVSKAFDTVPHEIIGEALRRKGLPELVVQLVEDSYRNVETVVKNGEEEIQINIQRGVKQGNPLSPLIFNMVM